jgi:hypothetical protein
MSDVPGRPVREINPLLKGSGSLGESTLVLTIRV